MAIFYYKTDRCYNVKFGESNWNDYPINQVKSKQHIWLDKELNIEGKVFEHKI